jgi:hypothetical protein
MNLSALKKQSSIGKLTKALDSLSGSTSGKKDERFWKPEVDKAGNGYAVIRFLDTPAVDGEDGMPWVQVFSHAFQGSGGWLIDNCLTSLGQTCPVCEVNSKHWNSGIDANKDIARKQKRKLKYIANILVIKDPAAPSNEGKVFLFEFGKKIFDKINEQIKPQFEDEKAINPFNFWEGANFKLKIRQVEGYRNYDKSEFDGQQALFRDDDEIEKVWKAEHSLKEFLDAKNFKSYDELKARLNKALGASTSVVKNARPVDEEIENEEGNRTSSADTPPWSTSDDDDTLSYFSKLAEE